MSHNSQIDKVGGDLYSIVDLSRVFFKAVYFRFMYLVIIKFIIGLLPRVLLSGTLVSLSKMESARDDWSAVLFKPFAGYI